MEARGGTGTMMDFPALNRALAAAFGPGVVECLPSDEADYVLQFSRGETEAEVKRASGIIAGWLPFSERVLRRVERKTKDEYQEWRKVTP
jgi:hypothetical protein